MPFQLSYGRLTAHTWSWVTWHVVCFARDSRQTGVTSISLGVALTNTVQLSSIGYQNKYGATTQALVAQNHPNDLWINTGDVVIGTEKVVNPEGMLYAFGVDGAGDGDGIAEPLDDVDEVDAAVLPLIPHRISRVTDCCKLM
jgi:hypothetical protein